MTHTAEMIEVETVIDVLEEIEETTTDTAEIETEEMMIDVLEEMTEVEITKLTVEEEMKTDVLTEIEEMTDTTIETEETIDIMTETGIMPAETEQTTTILEGMKGISTDVGKTLLHHCYKGFKESSMVIIDNASKIVSPAINEGLDNLKESIPELKHSVDTITSIPVISKFLRKQKYNKK